MLDKFAESQKTHFDEFFTDTTTSDNFALRYEFNNLVAFMGELKGKRILDLGCGPGRLGLQLAKYAEEVVGMDISPVAVNQANEQAKQNSIANFRAIQDDFKKVEFNEYFDYVLCVNMLHHTNEGEQTVANIFKTLKKGGRLIIFENNSFNPLFIPFFIMIGQLRAHLTVPYLKANKYYLTRLVKRHGFLVEQLERYGFLPTMLYNYSTAFIGVNKFLNRVPLLNEFAAFHLIKAIKT